MVSQADICKSPLPPRISMEVVSYFNCHSRLAALRRADALDDTVVLDNSGDPGIVEIAVSFS
jgi:hypothetical protein